MCFNLYYVTSFPVLCKFAVKFSGFLQNMQTLSINRTTFKLFTWMMGRWLNSVRTEDENMQKIVYRIWNTFHTYIPGYTFYIYIRLKSVDSRGHFLFIYLGTIHKTVYRLPKSHCIHCDLIRQKQKQISLNCALFFLLRSSEVETFTSISAKTSSTAGTTL